MSRFGWLLVAALLAGCAQETAPPADRTTLTPTPPAEPPPPPYDPFAATLEREMPTFANVTMRVIASTDARGYRLHATLTNEGGQNATIQPARMACRGGITFSLVTPSGWDTSSGGGRSFCASESMGSFELPPGQSLDAEDELVDHWNDGFGNRHEVTPGEYLIVARASVAGEPYGAILQQSVRVTWPPAGYDPGPERPS